MVTLRHTPDLQVPHDLLRVTTVERRTTHNGEAVTARLALNGLIIGLIQNDGNGGLTELFSPNNLFGWQGMLAYRCASRHHGDPVDEERLLDALVTEAELDKVLAALRPGATVARLTDGSGYTLDLLPAPEGASPYPPRLDDLAPRPRPTRRTPTHPTIRSATSRSRILAFPKGRTVLDNHDWPLPQSPTIDQVLRDLTEHADYDIADDGELDLTFAEQPHLILAWVAAAARYTAAEFQLQMLHHPITWMRMELAPNSDWDAEGLDVFADNMRRLLTEHGTLRTARADAHRDFTRACPHLETRQVLVPTGRQWRQIELLAHGLTEPMTVEVPADATAPWPLVKADLRLINRLVGLPAQPQPDVPVLRRALAGIVRVDHHGADRGVLSDPGHRYWLHGFAWTALPGDEDRPVAVEGGDR